MSTFPATGKTQEGFLKAHVFPAQGAIRPEVVSGPAYGVDVSVINLSEEMALVSATDPVSLIPTLGLQESAWLSVHLVASDIATAGCKPHYAQFCLNLPPNITTEEFHEYWNHISHYCEELNVAITGGHTGRVPGQNSTVAGGATMMSYVEKDRIITSDMACPGDKLVLIKEPAIISTAIMALSFPKTVEDKCGKEVLAQGRELFSKTSAVDAALTAVRFGIHENGIRAMHDVTEGGVLGAVSEMMTAAGCGVRIYDEKIEVGVAQSAIGELFDFDPRYSIGAGALLASVVGEKAGDLVAYLNDNKYPAAIIGEVLPQEEGTHLMVNGEEQPLDHPGVDPYWRAFFRALNDGLK